MAMFPSEVCEGVK